MTWVANQIYAWPTPKVIEAFSRQTWLANRIFLVDDLDGIRSPWVRERFFEDDLPEGERSIRHGLPDGGLLVVNPELYRNGYTAQDPPSREFVELFMEGPSVSSPGEKWEPFGTDAEAEILFPAELERSEFSIPLFRFLKSVATETATPVVYYWTLMWGGDIEEEVGWVFAEVDHVYRYVDQNTTVDHTQNGAEADTEKDVLQNLMDHLGLHLPTSFFALHEGSFDWQRYWLAGRT